ncbi:uncharacterized protein IUM83_02255 [Phytophthora cinnamomi]|uniref:uncharacterized protein n=1 Tax=Phytophthora cinnamomi TaxID=4785 RepID=UPI0035595021|nr:hypothetical protein IUM83_02255 [Phytophthora cinnamomi]
MPSRDEPTASSASSPSVPNPRPPLGVVRSAESLGRSSRASGVSGERDGSLIDLTNSLEFDRESGPASRTSPPRPPSSHGDTTSGAAGVGRSNSAEQASLSSLEALVRAESANRQEENAALARLLAFISTRPPPAIDPAGRRALLSASSLAEVTDVLQGQQPTPSSANDVAALRVELSTAESVNTHLSRRLDSLAVENAELRDKLEVAERERALWEGEAKKLAPFMTSLRKSLAATEASLKTAREDQSKKVAAAFAHAEAFRAQVRERDAEIARLINAISARDAEYATLQGVATKHFEQLTESARLLSSGDSQPLRHAQATIADQRRVILNQKRIIARQGFLPMHDPHMAAAAGAGLDVPGLDPAELQLNARLCGSTCNGGCLVGELRSSPELGDSNARRPLGSGGLYDRFQLGEPFRGWEHGSLGCCFGFRFGDTPAIILFDSPVIAAVSCAWGRPIQFDFVDRTDSSSKYSVEFHSACRACWFRRADFTLRSASPS